MFIFACKTPPTAVPPLSATLPPDTSFILRLLSERRFASWAGQWQEFKYSVNFSQLNKSQTNKKEKRMSVDLVLRWLPDSLLWLSISLPPAGEIIRAIITDSSAAWYDRTQKTAYILLDSTHTITSHLFHLINSALTKGHICDSFSPVQIGKDTLRIACRILSFYPEAGGVPVQVEHIFAGREWLPVGATIVSPTTISTITIAYSESQTVPKEKHSLWCPHTVEWQLTHPTGGSIAEFHSGKCKLMNSFNAPFKIPPNYEKVYLPARNNE